MQKIRKLSPKSIIEIIGSVIPIILFITYFITRDAENFQQTALEYILLGLSVSSFAAWLFFFFTKKHYKQKEKMQKFIVAILGALLLLVPLSLPLYESLHKDGFVTIFVTAERNKLSKNNEVWLRHPTSGDSAATPIANDEGFWIEKESGVYFTNSKYAPLTFYMNKDKAFVLPLFMHAWSGTVQVETANEIQIFDLYSEKGDSLKYTVPFSPVNRTGTFVSIFASLFIMIFLFSSFCLRKLARITLKTLVSGFGILAGFTCLVILNSYAFSQTFAEIAKTITPILLFILVAAAVALAIILKTISFKRDKTRLIIAAFIALFFMGGTWSSFVKNDESLVPFSLQSIPDPLRDETKLLSIVREVVVNGQNIDIEDYLTEGWQVGHNGIYTNQSLLPIIFEVPPGSEVKFIMQTSPDCGLSLLKWEASGVEKLRKLNLCAAEKYLDSFVITLPTPSINLWKTVFVSILSFVSVLLIVFYLYIPLLLWLAKQRRAEKREDNKENKLTRVFSLIISAITPLVFLFFLYTNNKNYISFVQLSVVALICSVLWTLAYLLWSKLLGSSRASSLIMFVFGIVFFTFSLLYENLFSSLISQKPFFVVVGILFGAIAALLYRVSNKFQKKELYAGISFMLSLILLMNLVPSINDFLATGNASIEKTGSKLIIDDTVSSPNIYWFHTDGMLSFTMVEELFGDSQEDFRSYLEQRDFVINEDAYFEALHSTAYSIPALMSPNFYDEYLESIYTAKGLGDGKMQSDFYNVLRKTAYSEPSFLEKTTQARKDNEFIAAFQNSGYYTNTMSYNGIYHYPTTTRFYDFANAKAPLSYAAEANMLDVYETSYYLESLLDLLSSTSMIALIKDVLLDPIYLLQDSRIISKPLNVSDDFAKSILANDYLPYDMLLVKSIQDSMQTPGPKLNVIAFMFMHRPFFCDENGTRVNDSLVASDINSYFPQHKYGVKVLTALIDFILEEDPGAVIVLQADHGIHHYDAGEQMLNEFGFTMQETRNVWNGVMSAVRIPEKFGGLEKPLDPLNISRELVNRYVGPNYDLLPEDHPNQKP